MKTLLLSMFILLAGCHSGDFKESKVFIGNQKVSSTDLNKGQNIYTEYCMACHGVNGDGNGPAAKGSIPAPRNFKQGLYKFGLVKDGGLPTDEDFYRIIKGGLHGTAMFPWDMSKKQIHYVTQYIKTFAPQVWENKEIEPGTPIEVNSDPYGLARQTFAIEKGKEIYHAVAQCWSCHRAYVSKQELSDINEKVNQEKITDFDSEMYLLKIQESEYYFYDSKERFNKYLPPDFTWHPIRSASTVEGIYKRLVAGVTGSGMPAWRGTITDAEIWAVSYYVKDLMKYRNDFKSRTEFISRIEE